MNHDLSRRQFLNQSFRVSIAAAAGLHFGSYSAKAIAPFQRSGSPRLLLGLAAYSFRNYFKDSPQGRNPSAPAAEQIDMFQFVDYCADHGCQGAEVTSYYFPSDLTDDYLLRLKKHAFLRGIQLSGTAIGNTFTHPPGDRRDREIQHTKKWIDHAAVMGAPHIRIFAGSTQGGSKEGEKRLCIEALEECGEYAGSEGIFLGLENHGGIVAEADDLLDIVRAVKSPWIGINLDTGNFRTDDPYGDLAKCAPYAVNVQIKTEIQKRGAAKEDADLARLIRILRDANYQGYVALEYEAAESPKAAVPRYLEELKELLQAG